MVNLGQSHWIVMKEFFSLSKRHFGLYFKRIIKDVIMGKVHFNKNVNHNQG